MIKKIVFLVVILIYNLFLIVLLPFIFIFFLSNRYINFNIFKRFGGIFKETKDIIVHCSSAGEASIGYSIFGDNANYTVFNVDGYNYLKKKNVNVLPLVFDILIFTILFLRVNKVKQVILIEQEIWPSLIVSAKLLNIKVFILNGKIYKKSFKIQYHFKFLYSNLFNLMEKIYVQSKNDFKLFIKLGTDKTRLEISGNFKLLIKPEIKTFYEKYNLLSKLNFKIVIFGSFYIEEFKLFVEKLLRYKNNYKYLIFPRLIRESNEFKNICLQNELNGEKLSTIFDDKVFHNENFIENPGIETGNNKNNLNHKTKIKLQNNINDYNINLDFLNKYFKSKDFIIVDKIGLLKSSYKYGIFSFVGGSFIDRGGQNFLESIVSFTPAFIGESYFNFEDLVEIFNKKGLFIINKSEIQDIFINFKDFYFESLKEIDNLFRFNSSINKYLNFYKGINEGFMTYLKFYQKLNKIKKLFLKN